MKGCVLLTDGRTALKPAHPKTLMSKSLRIQLVYVEKSMDDNESDDDTELSRRLTVWYWPKMKQPSTALIVTWAVPPCPLDTHHNWTNVNGSQLYNGSMAPYAILRDVGHFFSPAEWNKKCASYSPAPANITVNDIEEDDEDDLSFLVDNNETYVVVKKPIKDVRVPPHP